MTNLAPRPTPHPVQFAADAREDDRTPEGPPLASAIATAFCAGFAMIGWLIGGGAGSIAVFVLAYIAGGSQATASAIASLFRMRLSIDLLMILAALGAASLGDWVEGAVLLFLFSLSNTLEAYAMYRTTRSIDALIQLRPREASQVRDGQESKVPIEALRIGDVVRVRPGERFPVDGQVTEGESWADEATLTGESTPVPKNPGDSVFAGTINGRGSLLVRMARAVADTTLERIVRMVREAQAERAPTQRWVESWQGPYVAGVLLASAFVFGATWYVQRNGAGEAFYHAMVILVVSSPCAVVIGGPAVILSAIARAARLGVLMKGGAHLETLGRVEIVAFDKTGTITPGKPVVTDVWVTDGLTPDRILELAVAVEHRSEHHLASAVLAEANRRGVTGSEDVITEFHAHSGQGVHARVGSTWVGIGREGLFAQHDVALPAEVQAKAELFREQGRTALMIVVEPGNLGAVIAVADRPRPGARQALTALKQLGVRRIVMLTGDHDRVAGAVADEVGVDETHAGLLPDEKVALVRKLRQSGQVIAMVGDGVNDAPALAAANLGIAMGGAGTDVALEVADVVLMRDDLAALPQAIDLARVARRRVAQNMTIAAGMIGLLLMASFFGLPLWLGVVGHEGSTVAVVLNGLRMLWMDPRTRLGTSG